MNYSCSVCYLFIWVLFISFGLGKEIAFFDEHQIHVEECYSTASIYGKVGQEHSLMPDFKGSKLVHLHNTNATFLNTLLDNEGVDIWNANSEKQNALIKLSPEAYERFARLRVNSTVVKRDITRLIEEEKFARNQKLNVSAIEIKSIGENQEEWFKSYHPYEEIREWFIGLARDPKYYEVLTYYPSIGNSYKGTPIFIVKLAKQGAYTSQPKKAVWIQSLQHAREWITAAATNYFIYDLLVNATSPSVLDLVDVYYVPVVNPDGYDYTWNVDRTWRKNRRPVTRRAFGVDLNRNWDAAWGTEGVSRNPATQVYCGSHPFSEPETFAMRRAYLSISKKIVALDMHSFSQLIMYPYGHSTRNGVLSLSCLDRHREVCETMSKSMYSVEQKKYKCMESISLYPTSGTASDYFCGREQYELHGSIPYSFVIELRPDENDEAVGFLIPATEIIGVGKEIRAAVAELVAYALINPLQSTSATF